MKFTCTKENLSHALNLTTALTGKGTNLPILMNVLFTVTDSKVEITATNLEVAVRAVVRAKVDQAGSFTVPAKTLADYVHLLRDGQIELVVDGGELVITNGTAKTRLKGSSADEYPVIPVIEETHGYVLRADVLHEALTRTVIAVAKNEIRPELSGVYFGFFTDRYRGLLLAATDSYRLAESRVAVEQGADEMRIIVPARAVFEIVRLIGMARGEDKETQVRLWVSANQLALRYDNFEMTTRLIDGQYPDYAQIIPTSFKTSAVFPTDIMINTIKAAGLFATTGVNAVSFDLNSADKTVAVSSTSTQTGEHSSTIDADITGPENSILLNHRYVIEGLQHLGGDAVNFQMNTSDSPCLFQTPGQESYLYIVMPIRQ